MIAHLIGKVVEKFDNSVIIDVNGVGYEVILTKNDFCDIIVGGEGKFYTFHAIRENGEELYGFSVLMAKKMFEMLTTVQGVGPKAAMAILSLGTPEQVRNAIANADSGFVVKASGVGKKTAERVILELKEKVGAPKLYSRKIDIEEAEKSADEAIDALMALGFPLKEAVVALSGVDEDLPVGERVKLALKKR